MISKFNDILQERNLYTIHNLRIVSTNDGYKLVTIMMSDDSEKREHSLFVPITSLFLVSSSMLLTT